MHLARSSYRVQLHRDFTFDDLRKIIPYLDHLGISTIYAAPFFQAMPGSNHGYDVTNPHIINPEIGTLDEFRELSQELKARNMQWLQDIVPNHMAFSSKNVWLYDLMEKGPHSTYYHFFDIDWLYPDPSFYGKLMVPTLGTPLKKTIRNGEIKVQFGDKGFFFSYYDHHFPASLQTYAELAKQVLQILKEAKHENGLSDLADLAKKLEDLTHSKPEKRSGEAWDDAKKWLLDMSRNNTGIQQAFTKRCEAISEDYNQMEALLKMQFFRLSHWRITNNKINYRRFFTVNDLICLNMQEQEVFDTYHTFIKQLVDEGLVQGLRIDHIDGMLDPVTYLHRLRKLVGDDLYITVEKILEGNEQLPADWPIQGSSGYDFLAQVNQLFTKQTGSVKLKDYYDKKISQQQDYTELVFKNKRFILEKRMAGDLENLVRTLYELEIFPNDDSFSQRNELKEALAHLLVYFPVYRTYSNHFPFSETDMLYIKQAFELAEEKHPGLSLILQRLRDVFNGVADKNAKENENKLFFNLRTQQFTGPLAAKGVEDTTFYQYFPLASLNEVGDSPNHLGSSLDTFQEQMRQRPLQTINTTATHDTKRGEDARMRISLLSEIPQEWIKKVESWQKTNGQFTSVVDGQRMPDKNDEYFFYQILLGTYPFHTDPEKDNYVERLLDYLLKSIREAKVHSSWSKPNKAYREAYLGFAEKVIHSEEFIEDFKKFAQGVAKTAAIYSLGQSLLRITAPGVPDTYQGTEYWDLSMVDPDNRRPVDYPQREKALLEMEEAWQENPIALLHHMLGDLFNPRIKLFTIYQCLNTRKLYRPLFDKGSYQSIDTNLENEQQVLAFKRISKENQALILIPLGIFTFAKDNPSPLGEAFWGQGKLIADDLAGEWHHVFLNKKIQLGASPTIGSLLSDFPVALLVKN